MTTITNFVFAQLIVNFVFIVYTSLVLYNSHKVQLTSVSTYNTWFRLLLINILLLNIAAFVYRVQIVSEVDSNMFFIRNLINYLRNTILCFVILCSVYLTNFKVCYPKVTKAALFVVLFIMMYIIVTTPITSALSGYYFAEVSYRSAISNPNNIAIMLVLLLLSLFISLVEWKYRQNADRRIFYTLQAHALFIIINSVNTDYSLPFILIMFIFISYSVCQFTVIKRFSKMIKERVS